MIRLLVGLGNPTSRYEKTRHNAGFIFLDQLADVVGARWSLNASFQAEMAQAALPGGQLLLCKPQLFMNRSAGR